MIKKAFLLLGLACILVGGYSILEKSSFKKDAVSIALGEMTSDEKWFLDFFFRNHLLRDSGAYVLKGCKPVGLSDFLGPKYYLSTVYWRGYKRSVLFKKGYEIWKKYQHMFPSISYCICYRKDEEDDDQGFDVYLINKKNVLSVVSKNIEEFQAHLGPDITPEILLEKIINEGKPLTEILHGNAELLGMILGYGKHNSQLFYRREILKKEFTPKKLDLIAEEIAEINKKLQCRSHRRNHLIFASLPTFVFDPTHQETQELNDKYEQQRKEFTNLYKNGKFLETTLRVLTSSPNA